MNKLYSDVQPQTKRLEILFYIMIIFALLGPTFGIQLTPNFKLTLFRVAFFLLALFLFMHLIKQKRLDVSQFVPIRRVVAFFLFWLVYAAVSLAWVMDLTLGIRYLFFLMMMIPLCLSLPYFVRTEKHLWRTVTILFGVFCIMVYFGLFESVTYFHLPSSRYWLTDSASVTSFFQNQNDFATAITLAFPFLGTALYSLKLDPKWKIFIYMTIIFALFCLLATGSRSNTFFAIPLILIVWLISLPFTVEKKKLLRYQNWVKGLAVILSISLMVGVMSDMLLAKGGRDKLASTLGIFIDLKTGPLDIDELDAGVELGKGTGGRSITVRKYLLLYGLDFLMKSHLIGVGAGNVEAHMKGKKGIDKVNIHNWWAEVLVNFGVIVFALYMFFYLWLLRRLWLLASLKKSPKMSPLVRWTALSTFISMIGFVFGGIAPSTCIHFTPMWIVLGLGLAVVVIGGQQRIVAR